MGYPRAQPADLNQGYPRAQPADTSQASLSCAANLNQGYSQQARLSCTSNHFVLSMPVHFFL